MESAQKGGFVIIPFNSEGCVRDEKALGVVEEETATVIRMQIRADVRKIVVVVCPGKKGRLGDVTKAAKLVKDLLNVKHVKSFFEGCLKDGTLYGRGAKAGVMLGRERCRRMK